MRNGKNCDNYDLLFENKNNNNNPSGKTTAAIGNYIKLLFHTNN